MRRNVLVVTAGMLVAFGLSPRVFAAASSTEILLNSYVRDLAARQVELYLPRGKFTLQVSVVADQSRIKSENEAGPPVRLPMGSSFLTPQDFKAGLTGDSAERLLGYVKKIEVRVSVMPNVPAQVRELVRGSLTSALALDSGRGDAVSIDELPPSFALAWGAATEANAGESLKPVFMLGGIIGATLLFAALLVFAAFRQIGSRISVETRALSAALKDALEAQAAQGQALGPAVGGRAAAAAAEPGAGHGAGAAAAGSGFWEKADVEAVAMFCHDCFAHPRYAAAPITLINALLPPDKSEELEKKLPSGELERCQGMKAEASPDEITELFQGQQAEYRRATRSPITRLAMSVPVPVLIPLAREIDRMETAILINSLTPLRRGLLLKELSTAFKMELAKATSREISVVEHKERERSLAEKLAKLAKAEGKEEGTLSMGYLSSVLLKAESFEEDEALYEQAKASGERYTSVLEALEALAPGDWEAMNLQETAAAFCGYSRKVKEELLSKFEGKRQGWIKNFLEKYGVARTEFGSPVARAAQEMVRSRLAVKAEVKSTTHEPESKAA